MKKNKKIFISIVSLTSLIATSFISLTLINTNLSNANLININNYQATSEKESINFQALSTDPKVQDQSSSNGFINSDLSTKKIFATSYLGQLQWEFDINTTDFFVDKNGVRHVAEFFTTKYNPIVDRIIVTGWTKKTSANNGFGGFMFQINAVDGTPYFANNDPNIPVQQKYIDNILTTSNKGLSIEYPEIINFDSANNCLLFMKQNITNQPTLSKINLDSNLSVNFTWDNSIYKEIGTPLDGTGIMSFVSIEKNLNFLVMSNWQNSNNPNNNLYIKQFNIVVVDDNLNALRDSNNKIVRYFHTSQNPENILYNNFIADFQSNINGNNVNCFFPIVNYKHSFLKVTYNKDTKTFTGNNSPSTGYDYQFIDQTISSNQLSYITYNTKTKKYYGTNGFSNANQFLVSFDITNETWNSISTDQKIKGSRLAPIFDVDVKANELPLFFQNGENLYSGIEVSNNLTNLKGILSPSLNNPADEAKNISILKKLPYDVTNSEVISLLKVTNYQTNEYKVELSKPPVGTVNNQSFISDSTNGKIDVTYNLQMKKWWNDTKYFSSFFPYEITGFNTFDTLKFNLVQNSTIDLTKYNNIVNLGLSKFPYEITKKDILDNFISYGSGLTFTENDISIDESGSTKQIKVTTDSNAGSIKIDYKIANASINLPLSSREGSFSWNNFKPLDNWSTLSLNDNIFKVIKATKFSSQINVSDVVKSLNLSPGFSQKPSDWKWETTDANNFINNNINGIVVGKLTYIPRANIDPITSRLPSSVNGGVIEIKANSVESIGCKTMASFFGDNTQKNNSFSLNEQSTNAITVTKTTSDVIADLKNILNKNIIVTNNWINASNLNYKINSSTDTSITLEIFVPDNVTTNIQLEPNVNLVLNDQWKSIFLNNANLKNIYNPIVYTIQTNQANFQWNYGIQSSDSSISVNDLGSSSSILKNQLPSQYIDGLTRDPLKGYIDFQNQINLLNVPGVTTQASSNLNDYIIDYIELVPNDTTGTLLVNYQLSFPQLNNATKVASILITGTRNIWEIIIFWLVIISIIALFALSIFGVVWVVRKNYQKKHLFSTNNFRKRIKKHKK